MVRLIYHGRRLHNDGSLDLPWATLAHAMRQAQPGDTIYVRGGTYDEGEIWISSGFGMGGRNGKFVTIIAYPGEEPIFNNPSRSMMIGTQYVRIEGLHFHQKRISVGYEGNKMSEHIEIINNCFEGGYNPHIYFMCNKGLIQGNTFTNSGSYCLYIMHGDSNIIRDNYCTGMGMYGIHVYDENKYQYVGENNPSITNLIIENNYISGSQTRAGIIISAGESSSKGIEIDGVTIRNNVITNNAGAGIAMYYYGSIRNVDVFNNVIYGNDRGIHISADNIKDIRIKNNIFAFNRQSQIEASHVNNLVVTHNLYWQPAAVGSGAVDSYAVYGDPLFVNANGNDFHIREGSPAINAGVDVGLPYNGVAPDIGAFEYTKYRR